ncbi:MAG: PAS domain S-box protein [bacterium]
MPYFKVSLILAVLTFLSSIWFSSAIRRSDEDRHTQQVAVDAQALADGVSARFENTKTRSIVGARRWELPWEQEEERLRAQSQINIEDSLTQLAQAAVSPDGEIRWIVLDSDNPHSQEFAHQLTPILPELIKTVQSQGRYGIVSVAPQPHLTVTAISAVALSANGQPTGYIVTGMDVGQFVEDLFRVSSASGYGIELVSGDMITSAREQAPSSADAPLMQVVPLRSPEGWQLRFWPEREPAIPQSSNLATWAMVRGLIMCVFLLGLGWLAELGARQTRSLVASEAIHAALLETATDAIVTIDPLGAILSFNDAAERMFGYNRSEVLGKNVRMLMPDPYRTDHDSYLQHYQHTGERRIIGLWRELAAVRSDGTIFPMELAIGEARTADDYRFTGIVRDLTDRKKVEVELRRALTDLQRSNHDLEEFAYVASHDLQEPLRMVASFTDLLELKYGAELDDQARNYMSFASDGARRMKSLLEALLNYSRATTQPPKAESIELERLLDDIFKDLNLLVVESEAQIVRDPMPVVLSDPAMLRQILQNLIANAIKFRSKHALVIKLTARRLDKAWEIGVTDNGIGFNMAYAERIFLIFQRLHARGEYPGTGIGLAVVRKLVHRLGGEITVESTQGVGSTFRFTIPDSPFQQGELP